MYGWALIRSLAETRLRPREPAATESAFWSMGRLYTPALQVGSRAPTFRGLSSGSTFYRSVLQAKGPAWWLTGGSGEIFVAAERLRRSRSVMSNTGAVRQML